MMAENSLYKMQPVLDNPTYEGFSSVRKGSILGGLSFASDFLPRDRKAKGRKWTISRLGPVWKPESVVGRVRAFNDYPCIDLIVPAFSRRAIDALRDFLEPNGELLPLESSVGEYYAYNVTTVADILDQDRSAIHWLAGATDHSVINIFEVDRYECIVEKMAGLSIFHLVEMPALTYVSQVFVDRVKEHALQGFNFVKLWPLPSGVSWKELYKKELKKQAETKTKRGRAAIKGNTVVLCFPTARSKPSGAEKKRLATIMDEIDALLYDPDSKPNAQHLGSLEGDDAGVEGEIRLFLSCPDANSLVAALRPWLKRLAWPSPIRVLKRYGVLTDPNCREEYVDVAADR